MRKFSGAQEVVFLCSILLVVFARIGHGGTMQAFDANYLPALSKAGIAALGETVFKDNDKLLSAVNLYRVSNKTCQPLIAKQVGRCQQCLIEKCKERGKNACSPNDWQQVLKDATEFFSKQLPATFAIDIPASFELSIPDVIVHNADGVAIDITNDIADFFTNSVGTVGGKVIDLGSSAIDAVKGLGTHIANTATNVGQNFVSVAGGFGNKVIYIGKTVFNGVKDFGGRVGDAFKSFGSLFGRRAVVLAPACDDFQDKMRAGKACMFYFDKAFCPDCTLDLNSLCPGYNEAVDKVKLAENAHLLHAKEMKQRYDITEVLYDPTTMDTSTGNYKVVQVKANVFGVAVQFMSEEPVTAYNPWMSGPPIGRQAAAAYRKATSPP